MTTTGQSGQRWFRLPLKCVLQDRRQSRLPFWHPARIVLAHGLLVVAEQVGDVGDGHAPL